MCVILLNLPNSPKRDFIPVFPPGKLGHREVKWFGQSYTACQSHRKGFIPGLSNLEVPVLSSVTYGFSLSKKLSSQCRHSKGEVAKRLASFQQLLHGQTARKDRYCRSEVRVYNLSSTCCEGSQGNLLSCWRIYLYTMKNYCVLDIFQTLQMRPKFKSSFPPKLAFLYSLMATPSLILLCKPLPLL